MYLSWKTFIPIDMQDENSVRRYKFLEYDDGRTVGGENNCNNLHTIRAESWWNWFVHCSNCFCYCEEHEDNSDRFFSLRPILSNTKENKYLTIDNYYMRTKKSNEYQKYF